MNHDIAIDVDYSDGETTRTICHNRGQAEVAFETAQKIAEMFVQRSEEYGLCITRVTMIGIEENDSYEIVHWSL